MSGAVDRVAPIAFFASQRRRAGEPLSCGRAMRAMQPLLSALLLLLLATGDASAHASDRGYVLLLPTGHYVVGGAIAVAASFLALVLLPPGSLGRLASARLPLLPLGSGARPAASLFSFLLLVALVAAGFLGSRDPLSNPLPLTLWTLLWVGLTLAQGIFGNLWAWINPWFGPYWIARSLGLPSPLLRLPERIGYWPAVIQFAGFAWFELIDPAPDDPARLATIVVGYAAVNLAATLIFGYRDWSRRGEFLSVFFGMISAFAILQRRGDDDRRDQPRPARCRPRQCQPAAAERHLVPAAGAVVGIVRRLVAHLLLARAERRQPARISRPLSDDRDQFGRAVRGLHRAGRGFFPGGVHRRKAHVRTAAVRRSRRPLCLVDRADRARLSFRALPDCAPGQRPVRHRRACPIPSTAAGTCSAPRTWLSAPGSPAARRPPGSCGTHRPRRSSPGTCSPCWSRICWRTGCTPRVGKLRSANCR